jgi:uncharacterized protein YndB with AHSA1/START domain
MIDAPLAFSLDRTIVIAARRPTVFRFFTDSARFARWWGDGSSIDPTIGGAVSIRYPDGSRASGVVLDLVLDELIAFTYGYDRPEPPIAPGGSLVTITLADDAGGTRLTLRHDVASAAVRDQHVQGWRYQLSVFARVASAEEHAGAADAIARWYAAWNERDDGARRALLARTVSPDLRFADPNGLTRGIDDLSGHIGGALRFMPGITLEARGTVRVVHGTALADWATVDAKGAVRATGTSVFRLAPDGRIDEVVGVPT